MRAVLFLLLVPFLAQAETVINYDDGSTYTLADNQEIYISTPNSSLFKRQLMSNKDTYFRVQKPWTKRDYVPQPQDPYAIGSVAWCESYVPWSEGLTFDMISWQRACDTNNDGAYVFCDDYTPTSQQLTFGYSQPTDDDDRYDEECTDENSGDSNGDDLTFGG
jgi:hypothetical protein